MKLSSEALKSAQKHRKKAEIGLFPPFLPRFQVFSSLPAMPLGGTPASRLPPVTRHVRNVSKTAISAMRFREVPGGGVLGRGKGLKWRRSPGAIGPWHIPPYVPQHSTLSGTYSVPPGCVLGYRGYMPVPMGSCTSQ